MFFVIISISIYIFGIYLILVLSNCNAIQSTECHVRYFNKLSIYLSADWTPNLLLIGLFPYKRLQLHGDLDAAIQTNKMQHIPLVDGQKVCLH